MSGLKSIVVGIDFSGCSRAAMQHALRIAGWSGASVHAIHVVDVPADPAAEGLRLSTAQHEIGAALAAEARARWPEFAASVPGAAGMHLEIRTAGRIEGIRLELESRAADLLVVGARGAGKPNVGLGTLATGCLRNVPTDVLIVRDNSPIPLRTIVAGIDFSSTSRRALDAAARVARGEDARLYAVHVVTAPDGSSETAARLSAEHGPGLAEFTADATLELAGLEMRNEVFPYRGHRSGLLEFCAVVNADLLAIGTRGRTNLRDVVLGSTAEKVVRDSVCAVWASKPRD